VTAADRKKIENILNQFGSAREIEESNFGVGSELTSCAPGLFAAILKVWVEESLRFGTLSREESEEMAKQTLYGTAKLMVERNMGFDEVISRVATKGGMTEEGVTILSGDLPGAFQKTFATMGQKRTTVTQKLRNASFPQ
jgi:pyrroline-5-carboxylate reductase